MNLATQTKLSTDMSALNKHQIIRIKDIVLRNGVESIKKSVQINFDENHHKNERIESHIKDCRKELRRLASNMELKNDSLLVK